MVRALAFHPRGRGSSCYSNPVLHSCEKSKAGFPLGEFVRANREKSNLIGWRQTLTTSPANHIRFLLVRANKFADWKTSFSQHSAESRGFSPCVSVSSRKESREQIRQVENQL